MVEHRSLVNYLCWCVRAYPFCAGEGVPVQSSIAFDFTVTTLFGPLLAGSTVHLLPEEHGVEALRNALREGKRFSLIKITPAHLELLSHQLSPGEVAGCAQAFVIGGENLPGELLMFWQQHAPDTALFNEYGPTEAAVGCCVYEAPRGRRITGSVPIGRPIANTRAFVLDRLMQPAPVGAQGELYIAGDGLARGYLHRPDLTAERFFPDPFSQQAGARLYLTGDLARWLPDGTLEFLGRLDRQVKIRGFRVELEEVEAALAGHPSVRECATLMHEGARGEKRLVAYVVSDDPGSAGIPAGAALPEQRPNGADAGLPSAMPLSRADAPRSGANEMVFTPAAARPRVTELRRFLEEKLPPYAVPSSFVFLERLPLTTNGKVDRRALPAPCIERQDEDKSPAPCDAMESQLVKLWEDELGVRAIGAQERFADLGGHSLQAARLVVQVERMFGKTISAATLCEVQTIERLARVLRGERIAQSDSSIVAIQPGDSAPPLFFVHGLGGGMLWGYTNLSRHLGPGQPVYAFKSRGSDQLEEFSRIEEMAAHYVEDLVAFQPSGPYCLGGYCFGGNVAYEMARQLRAQGHPVALLVLFNSMPPNSSYFKARWTPRLALRFMQNSWAWLVYFRQWRPEQRRDFFRRKARLLKKNTSRWLSLPLFGEKAGLRPGPPKIEAQDWLDLSTYAEYERKLWDIHIRNLRDYLPKPYAGHVTLFRTRVHPFFCSFDPTFGWAELAQDGVTVKIVPGGHESILEEPNVQVLARELAACLRYV
jgi:thioesterase domain-containing protein/acyl carrier protein